MPRLTYVNIYKECHLRYSNNKLTSTNAHNLSTPHLAQHWGVQRLKTHSCNQSDECVLPGVLIVR